MIKNDALQLMEQHTSLMEDVEKAKTEAYKRLDQGYQQQAVSILAMDCQGMNYKL